MAKAMSIDELLALPVSFDLPTAGRAHGIGRTKSHELARRGEFPCPVKKIGSTYRVTRVDLLRSLGIEDALLAQPGSRLGELSEAAAR